MRIRKCLYKIIRTLIFIRDNPECCVKQISNELKLTLYTSYLHIKALEKEKLIYVSKRLGNNNFFKANIIIPEK